MAAAQRKQEEIGQAEELLDARIRGLTLAQSATYRGDLAAGGQAMAGVGRLWPEVARQVTSTPSTPVTSPGSRSTSGATASGAVGSGRFRFGGGCALAAEAREKFSRVHPVDMSQASRISGITPADLAVLMVHLK